MILSSRVELAIHRRAAMAAVFLILAALAIPRAAEAQNPRPIRIAKPASSPMSRRAGIRPRIKGPAKRGAAAQTGASCTLITFEGLGDEAPIPTFQGISMPDWLSIIEDDVGGTGNFSDAPGGDTIAFWLNGNPNSQNILIPNGASSISFYYSSYYDVTVSAYDSMGNLLNTVTGYANYDDDTDVYDIWSFLQVNTSNNAEIASITIDGYADYTGISNLDVCQVTNIDSVEITQAIQQYQTLTDLQTSLTNNGEPPVPIIAGKPAVLRCYFSQPQDVTNVTVQLSGVSSETKMLAVQPNCADANQRAGTNGCQSMDFYFTPPSGTWQAVLDNLDTSGDVLQEVTLNVTSRTTNSILLKGVSICDALDASNNWLCGTTNSLMGKTTLLSTIAPTSTVSLTLTSNVVRENYATFMAGPGTNTQDDNWWDSAIRDVNAYYGLFDTASDFLLGQYTVYFGQIRPQLAGGVGGMAHGIPSHGAGARTSVMRLGVETNVQVVAHETGHTLGLKHTNTQAPAAGAAPPGCYNLASDSSTDWPFANNYIQSTAMLEYGFDVPGRTIKDPNVTFDMMSYCVPRWVSPQRYKSMITALGGAVASPSLPLTAEARPEEAKDQAVKPATSANPAQFWHVRGVIQNSAVQFGPLFQLTIQGNTSQGSGTYSLLELSSTGSTIFTRLFTPESPATETAATDQVRPPGFSQVIPVNAGVAAIVVHDPTGVEIGRITITGAVPKVAIASPGAGFVGTGTETVSWTIQNLSGNTSYSRVLYSADNGSTWAGIADLQNATSVPVDFDTLPGSNSALIQVLVSDGVNTGSGTSVPFTVTKKTPMVEIDNPLANSVQPAADPVYLSGSAYNPDVGMLTGAALAWSSNLQGALGTGSPLSVHLQPGNHTIQLKATDSEGNSVSASVNVTIGGGPPAVGITATAQNTTPTTCEGVSVTAQPGTNGAPLSSVQVSLNGGASYKSLPLGFLPYSFVAPGTGFFHLVARAYDTSGQSNAKDVTFLTSGVCSQEACNVTNNLTVTATDVQLEINEALGTVAAANDLNADGVVNILDVQYVMNAALNKGCGGA